MPDDPYRLLRVSPDAEPDEIRAAYRRQMRLTHPDVRPGDDDAIRRARNLNLAWELLKDGERRAAYDRGRTAPARVSSPTTVSRAPAYSRERRTYRLAFTFAMLKVGLALVAIGLVLIGLFSA